jgi:hypothetical protein
MLLFESNSCLLSSAGLFQHQHLATHLPPPPPPLPPLPPPHQSPPAASSTQATKAYGRARYRTINARRARLEPLASFPLLSSIMRFHADAASTTRPPVFIPPLFSQRPVRPRPQRALTQVPSHYITLHHITSPITSHPFINHHSFNSSSEHWQ